MNTQHTRSRKAPGRRGFTLIEAAMTTVIVGVGFMATLSLLAAGTASNIEGTQTTTAVNLAKNVREMTLKQKFSDLPTLNSRSYSPPIDSRGVAVSDFSGWTQKLTVQAVDPNRLTLDITDSTPDALRLTVAVLHGQRQITAVSWYVLDGTP